MQTLLSHARRVLSTRNAERDQRVDIVLSPHLRRRLGNDLTTRYEALVAIAATAADAIELRRERDLQLARGRPDLAQPLGGRLAVAESTILDLLATVAGAGQQDNDQHTAPRRPGRLKDRADARASELAGIYADGLRAGCASDGDMANYLNARGEPPMGQSSMWTVSQCGNLRRRLTRLGLARLALELGRRAAVRGPHPRPSRFRNGYRANRAASAPTAPACRRLDPMANPSTILNHPRRAEIDDAIADGWPNRRIAATFGVSKDAARRYRSGATRCAPAVADRPSPPAQIPPAGPSPQGPAAPHTAPGDPFDILDAHYPWAPGEIPQPDPLAQQLRYTQRQHGTAAVRDAALAVIAQHQHTGLTDTVLARKMDVPPSLVVRWRVEQEKEQLARLSREPRSILARELAAIDQRERLAWQQLSTTNVGGRTWVAAQSTLNVLFRQRMELLKASGVSLELPEPAGRSTTPLTDRGMRMADMLKSSIAEVCVAAGADANQTLDQGLDYLSQLCAAPPTGNSDLD